MPLHERIRLDLGRIDPLGWATDRVAPERWLGPLDPA